ncbi:insecticidal delta-endotoxin Cry8Ea1 family protein [Burkholderia sp. FERM BP-3421]|jgi:delta endotoxin, N-terminal domain|uniref:insecticidal delta-endotoxin Cry8Ea1 family protein n=1 Tax=Burkholderia sp. FERM BP-3421 TaxID=1494466 RepID=UPI002361BB69|nr:insecticidal delta-endotoxin Cry8Ea1 family protein [Burkholderia sp. FERM BP-3421]WDD95838.1 insecticidal delta-endotoxin Cry8Ea1 family protein [Burkholderia sp. FERM BP-3421]
MLTRRSLLKTVPALGLALTLPAVHGAPVASAAPLGNLADGDILNTLKILLTWGVSEIPEVGGLLSTLVSLLWPSSGPDPWEQVRQQVEAMIDRKLDAAVFSLLKAKLAGLGDALKLYVQAVATKDGPTMRMQFIATNTLFVAAAAEFRNPDHEWTLAPLFALFTQLHMSLLRDCVLNGKDWGWNAAAYADVVQQARDTTDAYVAHLDQAVAHERARLASSAPASPGPHQTALHDYWQPFEQQRIVLIDDYRVLLVLLDPVRHPGVATMLPFKDVYSLAYGTADDWDGTCRGWAANGVATPFGTPLADFTAIDIELFNATPRVVNVRHATGQGPRVWGAARSDRYGILADPLGGVERYTVAFPAPGPERRFNVAKAVVTSGSIPVALTLVLADGTRKTLWNRTDLPGTPTHEVTIPGRMLTTLNMWSRSRYYDSDLGCVIFGFSRDARYVPPHVKDLLYIGAVAEPNTGPAYLPRAISPTLQARREAFWRDIDDRPRR